VFIRVIRVPLLSFRPQAGPALTYASGSAAPTHGAASTAARSLDFPPHRP